MALYDWDDQATNLDATDVNGLAFNVVENGVTFTVTVNDPGDVSNFTQLVANVNTLSFTPNHGTDGSTESNPGENDSLVIGLTGGQQFSDISIDVGIAFSGVWQFQFDGTDTQTISNSTPTSPVVHNGVFSTITIIPPGTGGPLLTITSLTSTIICFASGTAIATPDGQRSVEDFEIGDLVTTHDGRAVPVKWVGRQTVDAAFMPPERLCLVRCCAGAFGHGLPERDLVLTADHAVLIDGMLVNAGALVNHGSIDWVPQHETGSRYTVYHIETEEHDLILAEGAASETYLDVIHRQNFDNYQEYLDLYGAERIISEMDRPRISAQRLVPATMKSRLAANENQIAVDTGKVA